jgi:hypothetical protein
MFREYSQVMKRRAAAALILVFLCGAIGVGRSRSSAGAFPGPVDITQPLKADVPPLPRIQFREMVLAFGWATSDTDVLFQRPIGELLKEAESVGYRYEPELAAILAARSKLPIGTGLTPLQLVAASEPFALTDPEPDPGQVAMYESRFGLSSERAVAWAMTIESSRVELIAAAYQYQSIWGGVWLNHQKQSIHVFVTRDDVADLVRLVPSVIVELVPNTESEIRTSIPRVRKVAQAVFNELPPGTDVSIADDLVGNRIVVTVPPEVKVSDADLDQLGSAANPVRVVVENAKVDPVVDSECRNINDCGPILRGNMRVNGSLESCTSGFVYKAAASETLYGSTAGHCDTTGSYTHTSTDEGTLTIGPTGQISTAADGIDAKLIIVTDPQRWTPRGTVLRQANNDAPVRGSVSQVAASIGAAICKGGMTTYGNSGLAETCGLLTHKYETFAGNATNLGRHDGCVSAPGDSGAATFTSSTNTLAYGLHKGYSTAGCFFSWSSDVEALFNVVIVIPARARQGDQSLLGSPVRVVDSRINLGTNGSLAAGQARTLPAHTWQTAPSNAEAAIVTVTVVSPAADGFLTAWGQGAAQPSTSTTTFGTSQTRATTAVVPLGFTSLGATQGITLISSVNTHVVVDLLGWMITPVASRSFVTTAPARIFDFICSAGQLCAQQVAGLFGVPSDAHGVAVNVTVVAPTANGYLAVGGTVSANSTSLVNYQAGSVIGNLGLIRLNTAGQLQFYSPQTVRILVDLSGWSRFNSASPAPYNLTYSSVQPRREYDATVGAGNTATRVSPAAPIPSPSAAVVAHPSVDAVLLSLAGANATTNTFHVVWKNGSSQPGVANLNLQVGAPANSNHAISNAAYVAGFAIATHRSDSGTNRRIVDVVGYFD